MMRPTRRDADHGDVRAEMRLDARARARGPHRSGATGTPAPDSLGTSVSRSPRSSRWRGAARRRGWTARPPPPRSPHVGACASGADEACCAALGGWNDAGCFCPGVESAVSQSDTFLPARKRLPARRGVRRRESGPGDARHVRCPLCRRRRGRSGGIDESRARDVGVRRPGRVEPRLAAVPARLVGGDRRRRRPLADGVLRGDALRARLPPSEAACAQSMTTQTVDVPLDASIDTIDAQYSLEVPQTPSAPVTAFVSLTAVAGDARGARRWVRFARRPATAPPPRRARQRRARVHRTGRLRRGERGRERVRRALGTLRGPDRRARRRRRLGRDVHGSRAGGGRVPPRRTRERRELRRPSSAPRCRCASPGWWGPGPAPACDRARTGHFASPPFPPRSPRSSAAPPRTLGGSWRSRRTRCGSARWKSKTPPARRAAGSSLPGAGVNVEVTDTVFRACSAGGAGGGVAALDGAAVALADSAALDCAGGADGTGNEVRGGGVSSPAPTPSRRCATSLPSGVRSPRRMARAGA